MLEESSFANRKADYFWLLFQSAVMLLVRPSHSHTTHTRSAHESSSEDALPARESPIPFLPSCLCPNLPLVSTPPIHTHISLWPRDDLRSLSPARPRRCCLDGERHLESRRSGPSRVCGRPCWVVHAGCLDKRDGWQSDDSERCPGCAVCFLLLGWRVTLINFLFLGNGCSGIFKELNGMHLDVLPTSTSYVQYLPLYSECF